MEKQRKPLFSISGKLTLEEYKNRMKKTGEFFRVILIRFLIIGIILLAFFTLAIEQKVIFYWGVLLLLSISSLIAKGIEERQIEKDYQKRKQTEFIDEDYIISFYKDYMIKKSNSYQRRIDYIRIINISEDDKYFYIKYSITDASIIIDRNSCEDELCALLRDIIKQNSSSITRKKERHKNKNYTKLRKDCFILLMIVLTIISFYFSDSIAKYLKDTSLQGNGIWVYYFLLLFPIISVTQLLTRKNKHSKVVSMLVVILSFCGVMIFFTGWSNFSFIPNKGDYHKQITKYEKVLSITLPELGRAERKDPSFYGEGNMTETTMIEVLYDDTRSVRNFENKIIDDEIWIKNEELDEELEIFSSYQMINIDDDCYYLIYNQTNKEWNKFPTMAGKYHIYVAVYSMNQKKLQINDFYYDYQP